MREKVVRKVCAISMATIVSVSVAPSVFAQDESTVIEATETYLVSYVNGSGIVEFTRTVDANQSVDLSVRLGGGENQIGWSLQPGGQVIDSLTVTDGDITLYPVLDTSQVSYTIHYMQGDTEVESVIATGTVGDSVSADIVQSSSYAKSYAGYTYDASRSVVTEVKQDGSTHVYVYFVANEYTVQFDLNGNYRDVSALYYASLRMEIGGTTYSGSDYSITTHTGESISDWPTKANIVDNPWLVTQYSDYFVGWSDTSGNVYTSAEQIQSRLADVADSNGVVHLSARWASTSNDSSAPMVTITYNIYQQTVNQDGYELVETIEKEARATAVSTISLNGYEGFAYSHTDSVGEKTSVSYGPWYSETTVEYYEENNVYFDRESYTLDFKVGNDIVSSQEVVFGKSLSSYHDFEPENRPSGRAYFDGWYDRQGAIFSFDSLMPSSDVTLTGQWRYGELVTNTLSYDSNGGQGTLQDMMVGTGSTVRIADGSLLIRKGYTFVSWNTTADGNGQSYVPNDLFDVNEDVVLYAQWQEDTYTLTYDLNGGSWDEESLLDQASVFDALTVRQAPTREGYIFKGWQNGETLYQPNDVYSNSEDGLYVDGTLVAIWEEVASKDANTDGSNTTNEKNTNDSLESKTNKRTKTKVETIVTGVSSNVVLFSGLAFVALGMIVFLRKKTL